MCGQLAQLVEQRIENPRVLGSIPRLATKTSKATFGWLLFLRCLKNPCQFIVAAYMNGNATTDKKPERRCECGSFPCVAVRRFDIEYDFVTVIQCTDDDMRFVDLQASSTSEKGAPKTARWLLEWSHGRGAYF